MFKEFKAFALHGSVLDMAVGIILGAAFGKVVTSLVSNVLMPPIGLLLGRVDFASLYLDLSGRRYASLAAARTAGAPVIAYGSFLNDVLSFLIVAWAVFLLVRQVNRLRRPAPAAAATTKDCPYCLSAIALAATRCPQCTSELPGS